MLLVGSHLFPIASRCETGQLFEELDEIVRILDAALGGDLLDGFFRSLQEIDAPVNALSGHILRQGAAAFRAEQGRQVAAVHIELMGNGLQSQIRRQVILDQGDGFRLKFCTSQ